MTLTALVPFLFVLAAEGESQRSFWLTVAAVVAILIIFIGVLIYVARRSRTEGKHPQDREED